MATILNCLVASCTKKLQDIITEESMLILGVQEELKELLRRTDLIRCSLNDAEKRRIEDSAVNNWLGQLRDAMYDADDIIDLARHKGSKLLPDHPSSSTSKSTACSGLPFSSCFSDIRTRHEVAIKIRSLNKKIEDISKDKIFLTFGNTQSNDKGSSLTFRKSSNLVEPNLVGKEIIHACRKLVDLLLANKEKETYKLAIIGTGGVGKTTLAQKIYNDQKVKGYFNKQAWVCVSKEYNEVSVLREILRNIGVHHEQDESVGELQRKLQSDIKEKSFLLVLDDVWQSDVWSNLLSVPLHTAATGIILITTRHDAVAQEINVKHRHRVDFMSVDVGWELLWKTMNVDEEETVQNLRDIGIEIVQKCGGLPLAIKVIARVLSRKDQTNNEWKKILSKNAWSMSNLPNELRGALYLSYDELPHHLKQCFIYCAIYPEDSTIYRDVLVRMWVAEGFIDEQEGQLLEDTAEEYYYELISRNLLQPNDLYFDHNRCKMHDLLRQLACHLSREECFVGDPESLGGYTMCKLRRVSVVTEKDIVVLPSMNKERYKVRTWRTTYEKSLRVENTFFKRLLYLRVLDLTNSLVQSIPGYIGNLIHLRLLDLDGTDISCLPESIGSLKNLQILNLQRCDALEILPLAITQLCNLRRLGLDDTPINQVPKGIGRLKFLNDLEGFPIGGGNDNTKLQDGWKLEELGKLSQLRRLDMINMEKAIPCSTDSLLRDKKYLKVLYLLCNERTGEPHLEKDVSNVEMVFEQLIPPPELEDLSLVGYFGHKYPTWLCTTHLSSVKHLNLRDCRTCMHVPPFGQLPHLKYLRIQGATAVTKIGPELLGSIGDLGSAEAVAFPKLECLVIRDMTNCEEWSFVVEEDEEAKLGGDGGDAGKRKRGAPPPTLPLLRSLKRLHIHRCPKLRFLPLQLAQASCLKELVIREASSLEVVENLPFLSDFLRIEGCGRLERVSNLPQVRVLYVKDCLNLRCVDKLDSLQQLNMAKDMQEISSLWELGLQQHHRRLHGEDLDVNTWL